MFLDTSGDANNTLYETLYGGDVPRYNRLDPLDLVRVNRRLGRQMAGDAEVGNTTADRCVVCVTPMLPDSILKVAKSAVALVELVASNMHAGCRCMQHAV